MADTYVKTSIQQLYIHVFFILLGLPWTPKVRQKDLDAFLDNSRIKFVGFPVHGDRNTLAGLPAPIHEGVKVLKQVSVFSLAYD